MNAEERLINDFLKSLWEGDTQFLLAAYAPYATITDPVVGQLHHDHARYYNAWLTIKFIDFRLEWTIQEINVFGALVFWQASMQTRRTRKNLILNGQTQFQFQNGKIFKQETGFNFLKLYTQLYGKKGYVLGLIPYFADQFRQKVIRQLNEYIQFRNSKLFNRKISVEQ